MTRFWWRACGIWLATVFYLGSASAECKLVPIGALTHIYAGASEQQIDLVPDSGSTGCPDPAAANGRRFRLVGSRATGASGQLHMELTGRWVDDSSVAGQRVYHIVVRSPASSEQAIEFTNRNHGETTWTLTFVGAPIAGQAWPDIGIERLDVQVASLTVSSIHAIYRSHGALGVGIDPTPVENGTHLALVDPTVPSVVAEAAGRRWNRLAQVTDEAKLAGLLDVFWRFQSPDDIERHGMGRPGGGGHLFWCAQPASNGVRIISEAGEVQAAGAAAPLFRDRLRFVAGEGRGAGDVRFNFWITAGDYRVQPGVCGNRRLLMLRDVTVAAGVRRASVPIPLVGAVVLRCGGRHTTGDRDVLTPTNSSVSACELDLTAGARSRLGYGNPRDGVTDLGRLYGPQRVEVTVTRDGRELSSRMWEFSPGSTRPFRLGINGDVGDNEEYLVEARIQVGAPTVVYRSIRGAEVKAAPMSDEVMSERFRYRATVRPRGRFGWDAPIRVFVTVPITPVAFRFPQASHRLTRSDEFTGAGFLPPRAGLLLAFEFWDYERRRSWSYPIPIRLVVGGYLLEASDQVIAPTFDVGLSIALPVMSEDSQLSSAVSLHALAEYDALDGTWGFVLAASAEVFSVFSGSTSTNTPAPSDE